MLLLLTKCHCPIVIGREGKSRLSSESEDLPSQRRLSALLDWGGRCSAMRAGHIRWILLTGFDRSIFRVLLRPELSQTVERACLAMEAQPSQAEWLNGDAVASPCVRLCRVKDGMCVGCGRTLTEIGQWTSMCSRDKQEVVATAVARLKTRGLTGRCGGRLGMSLVEMLVVITIIGVMMGLLLPAVHAAREAARKASCKNNLRQIGIALHAYHDASRTLPTGCLEWGRRQHAWSAFLLPFLEQGNLYHQIDFSKRFDAVENARAAATRLQVYECPTSRRRSLPRGQIDYGGLFGELMLDTAPDDGVFLHEVSIAFHQIRDGLTQTMAVAEDVGGPNSEWIDGRNIFVQAGGINDPTAWPGDNEIRSLHAGGAMTLFADGRTVFLMNSLDKRVLGRMITRAKGEVIDWP
jgi:prepilin-type N-terminal cleavage/methylation domain-containing protein